MSLPAIVEQFFAPVDETRIDSLLKEYEAMKASLIALHGAIKNPAISYVFGGGRILKERDSISALDADYWHKAISLTDVYEHMPAKRREEINSLILAWRQYRDGYGRDYDKPADMFEFSREAVMSTLSELLSSRGKFFCERVDGLFRALSGEHVTNQPQGFSKRMIIFIADHFGLLNFRSRDHVHDLRIVIAKFMGWAAPSIDSTDYVLKRVANKATGEWVTLDAGSLRVRAYKKGTAHLEIHPDMAWRLNCVLAHLYPAAIPEALRSRQAKAKAPKGFELRDEQLQPETISYLMSLEPAYDFVDSENGHYREKKYLENTFESRLPDPSITDEIERVMDVIGGLRVPYVKRSLPRWKLDYNPKYAINEIVFTRCIPDKLSHQFYPTPPALAKMAVDAAEITDTDLCLEPSAGAGGLAKFMPKDRTQCYDISRTFSQVLKEQGFICAEQDIMKIAGANYRGCGYDKIVMNPPYSLGRWKSHTEAVAMMLKRGGRMVAILPSTAVGGLDLGSEFQVSFSDVLKNQFKDASVSVVIVCVDRLR